MTEGDIYPGVLVVYKGRELQVSKVITDLKGTWVTFKGYGARVRIEKVMDR